MEAPARNAATVPSGPGGPTFGGFSTGSPLIGTVLDKYEILQKVGEGGMATVYRARHITLGREVAVKVLHPHLSSSQRNRQRFAREARAIEHLDHPNILRIYDYSGVDSEACFIVTEFIDGVTLQDVVRERGRIPSESAIIVVLQLIDALAYAHGTGIIHRDLKPENIMVRRDGFVKLTDFGIARFLEENQMTMTGALVGSPAYMSPEQAMEHPVDARSDLFSLGTVLFYLASGALPFTGSNPSVILRNIIEGNRPDLLETAPDASPLLSDVVERLLQTSPANRFQDARELEVALRACLAEVQVDPADERWVMHRLVAEPEAYEADLDAHLRAVLLERGRDLLTEGDHLAALRTLNRLLAMDPQNQEVLALVQGLHTQPIRLPRYRARFFAITALVAILGLAGVWWLGRTQESEGQRLDGEEAPRQESVEGGAPAFAGPAPAQATIEIPQPLPSSPVSAEGEAVAAVGPKPEAVRPVTSETEALPPPAIPSVPDELATVRVILDTPTWARIIIDGEERNLTGRDPVTVKPGRHLLRLENDFSIPYVESFEVAAGEHKEIKGIVLRPRPATVEVGDGVGPECLVDLDGTPLGSVAALGGAFSLPDPWSTHTVTYRCPGSPSVVHRLQRLSAGSVVRVPEEP
ncbi:MAG: protein kinase [Deltaproteobacteria bacterium]|nr:protein kinase [Deltaproteobacteria bacterium]